MKLRNILYYLAVIVLLTPKLWATNTNPVVTNVTFSNTGTTVTVHYDVTDAEQTTVTISMYVSSDGGATWNYSYGAASGNIGAGVAIGTNKTITWTYSGGSNPNFKIMIAANDEQVGGDNCGTVDYGGKTYTTIQIGGQCWLQENLDVGTRINGSLVQTNNSTIEKYCYNDDPANCTIYGGLYQWAEAVQYQNGATNTTSANPPLTGNVQGICPTGWHIPTFAELQTLTLIVRVSGSNALKAVGQGSGNGAGTNTGGFSALLAGERYYGGGFNSLGGYAFFWSSTELFATMAYYLYLHYNDSVLYFDYYYKGSGYSVRCVKD